MPEDFYSSYATYKGYQSPSVRRKDIARFDAEIWKPAAFSMDMSCLEIGSGTGAFLGFLASKGLADFRGIDHDPALKAVQIPEVAPRFECVDVWEYLRNCGDVVYDRIVLLDVLEHFSPEEGVRLLSMIKNILADQGKIVIKVPNASSPWGMHCQFGDLTHKSAYTPDSMRQLAAACELRVDAIYGQRRGSPRRMITDAILHKFLSWALLEPPRIWGANLYCILERRINPRPSDRG